MLLSRKRLQFKIVLLQHKESLSKLTLHMNVETQKNAHTHVHTHTHMYTHTQAKQ